MAPHAALKTESRPTLINNHRNGNWGAAGSLLRVFRGDRFNLLAGNGLKQTLVITVNTMRFSHREDLDGVSKFPVFSKVRRDRHRVPASGMRTGKRAGKRAGAENGIDLIVENFALVISKPPFMS